MISAKKYQDAVRPNKAEVEVAVQSSRKLASSIGKARTASLHLSGKGVEKEPLEIPASAMKLVLHMLVAMARGSAVTVVPIEAEITSQEAAEILNVSRPYVVKLIEEKALPARKVGRFYRLMFQDVLDYKRRTDANRHKALEELAELSQKLDMGY